MALFDEVQFPTNIGFTSTGGPQRQTQVVVMGSGAEARNARWANSRRQWDIVYGKLSLDALAVVLAFFEARNGRLIGFRFRDPGDYQSCSFGSIPNPTQPAFNDQTMAIGDGTTKIFQIYKNYTSGSRTWQRKIRKPVSGTILIGLNGVKQNSGFSIDYTTGLVTFVTAPLYGWLITWGGQFDTPVRFDTDKISIEHSDPGAAVIQTLPIIELPESELES